MGTGKIKLAASDLKLMIEARLRELHPECERAEVVINPPAGEQPWSASVLGSGPDIENECRKQIDGIVEQLRLRFDLA
jgi:hypothetical protein